MKEEKVKKNKSYMFYLIIMISVLIISGLTVSYAYYNVINANANKTSSTVTGKTECVSITLSDNGAVGLTYNYPISDTYAVDHVTPVKVTIKNTCPAGQSDIDYSVLLTSLSDSATSSTYIGDANIKTKINKTVGSNAATTIKSPGLLTSLTALGSTKTTYTLLMQKLNANTSTNATAFPNKKPYVVDSGKISSNQTIVYDTYLWINYDAANTTQNKQFKSIMSVVVNNPETLT